MTTKPTAEDRKCYMYRAVLRTDSTRDYIGVSIHPDRRWWEHENEARKGSPRRFCKALRKYGAEAFDWKIIAIFRNEKIARDMEEVAVLFCGLGHYNETLRMNGENGPIVFTDELRKKISENTKKAMAKPEVKAKVSASSIRMWENPETRALLTQNSIDRWKDPEFRSSLTAKITESMANPELKAYIAQAQKEGFATPEAKAKMSAAQSAKWGRSGYREYAGALVKEALASPEVKINMSKAQTERFARDGVSEETRLKRGDSVKKNWDEFHNKSLEKHQKLIRINLLLR